MSENAAAEDLRVQRTRALIERALFELTVEAGYSAVTVRDIARRARVNRSTFYRHYLDKQDLLDQYLCRLQAQVAEAAARADERADPEHSPAGLLLLLRHVRDHAAFYRVMLGERGDPAFADRLRALSERRYQHLFTRHGAPAGGAPADMRQTYISAATVGAVRWWLGQSQPPPAEELAAWLAQLSMMCAGITPAQPVGALGQGDR